jgi:hypothetical protein
MLLVYNVQYAIKKYQIFYLFSYAFSCIVAMEMNSNQFTIQLFVQVYYI